MLRADRSSRGDTLIEVLLAITVMAAVITLTMRTMSLGFSSVYNSTQRTEVQSLINGQVAILRAAHDQDKSDWTTTIVGKTGSAGTVANADGCTYTTAGGTKQFYFDNTVSTPPANWETAVLLTGHSQPVANNPIPSAGDGLWVEGVKSVHKAGVSDYYDFYVKACWQATGEGPLAQLKSVVRLYDQ